MTKQECLDLQKKLNALGAGLVEDGVYGPKTKAAEEKFLKPAGVVKPKPVASGDLFGAPWIGSFLHLLGKHETDAALNAALVPEWAKEGLPGYKTLAGNTHAWCSVLVNASFRKQGVPGTNSAAAASWSKWGVKCPFWFGAVCDFRHSSGGRHVGYFLYWIDKSRGVAAVYSGNSGNRLCVAAYNISGNKSGHDELVSGPRGPRGWVGQELSKAEVLAKYPQLKVGGTSGSTR